MLSVTPRAVSSAASSGHDQRDNGTLVSAGSWQARALASATCTGGEVGRAPAALAVRQGRQPACGEADPPGAHRVQV
jgi:hypothetical protein